MYQSATLEGVVFFWIRNVFSQELRLKQLDEYRALFPQAPVPVFLVRSYDEEQRTDLLLLSGFQGTYPFILSSLKTSFRA
jgi:hypothetical protein